MILKIHDEKEKKLLQNLIYSNIEWRGMEFCLWRHRFVSRKKNYFVWGLLSLKYFKIILTVWTGAGAAFKFRLRLHSRKAGFVKSHFMCYFFKEEKITSLIYIFFFIKPHLLDLWYSYCTVKSFKNGTFSKFQRINTNN